MTSDAPLRRSSHQTQWAAQFAVASELCKRGFEVALTMGNHPTKDIMVSAPSGASFGIDVKGLYKRNFWAVRPKPEKADVFYVFAFVPEGAPNRFFVMTQEQVNTGIRADFGLYNAPAAATAERLEVERDQLEQAFGGTLDWRPNREGVVTKITVTEPVADPSDRADWPRQHAWMIDKLKRMESAFAAPIAEALAEYDAEDAA